MTDTLSLCKLKDSLGMPGNGIHSYRLILSPPWLINASTGTSSTGGNSRSTGGGTNSRVSAAPLQGIAIIDFMMTIAASIALYIIISNITGNWNPVSLVIIFIIFIVLSIILHLLFCVDTAFILSIKNGLSKMLM